jgi:hypothetical protein
VIHNAPVMGCSVEIVAIENHSFFAGKLQFSPTAENAGEKSSFTVLLLRAKIARCSAQRCSDLFGRCEKSLLRDLRC